MNTRYSETPSKEFLDELRERARRSGWSHDYIEIRDFVRELHLSAGITLSAADLLPYGDEDDDEPSNSA